VCTRLFTDLHFVVQWGNRHKRATSPRIMIRGLDGSRLETTASGAFTASYITRAPATEALRSRPSQEGFQKVALFAPVRIPFLISTSDRHRKVTPGRLVAALVGATTQRPFSFSSTGILMTFATGAIARRGLRRLFTEAAWCFGTSPVTRALGGRMRPRVLGILDRQMRTNGASLRWRAISGCPPPRRTPWFPRWRRRPASSCR
jgi:hypothetical protein